MTDPTHPARRDAPPLHFEEIPADRSLADPLPASPFEVLSRWLDEAFAKRVQANPSAMSLATVGRDGRPSLRIVLCRGLDAEAGTVAFYTSRDSRKGRDLAACSHAAAVFHWDALARQARLEGPVAPLSDAESDAYFEGRPRLSQIAAWASAQSEPLASRETLLEQLRETEARFPEGQPVPRPPFWGGYRLRAERVELWVGSTGRAHDRALWRREGDGWTSGRLQP